MAESGGAERSGAVAFALIYLTFFLDNVLLTVLVPIIPDWVRGESLALWAEHDSPLAALLNHTVRRATQQTSHGSGMGAGAAQALVGLVLGAKAAAQLLAAPLAAAAVTRRGAAPVLRAATAALALAAAGFAVCGAQAGAAAALCAAGARVAHGGGAALAGVAGLALAARALPAARRHAGLGALLGAVALGVLVGYPFGGVTYALWSRGTPFLLIAALLLVDLALQYMFLNTEDYNQPRGGGGGPERPPLSLAAAARQGATGACAGGLALAAGALAALEGTEPLWLEQRFGAPRWQAGLVFVPDSLGYLLAANCAGLAKRLGVERVAIAGQVAVGAAALWVPLARSVGALAAPHALLGLGLGAADAALVPALLARAGRRGPARAALLAAAGAAAYAAGPALGAALAAAAGFGAALRAAAAANLLYAAHLCARLRQHPLSAQWGASCDSDEDSDEDSSDGTRATSGTALRTGTGTGARVPPLAPGQYTPLE